MVVPLTARDAPKSSFAPPSDAITEAFGFDVFTSPRRASRSQRPPLAPRHLSYRPAPRRLRVAPFGIVSSAVGVVVFSHPPGGLTNTNTEPFPPLPASAPAAMTLPPIATDQPSSSPLLTPS